MKITNEQLAQQVQSLSAVVKALSARLNAFEGGAKESVVAVASPVKEPAKVVEKPSIKSDVTQEEMEHFIMIAANPLPTDNAAFLKKVADKCVEIGCVPKWYAGLVKAVIKTHSKELV
jgi:hypothetical protein